MLLYDVGHIPGAVKVDWHTELNDPVTRDYLDGAGFAKLMSAKGISRDDTVVIYGDKNNWWAAYALWVFTLFGHEDVRLLDGGRASSFSLPADGDLLPGPPEQLGHGLLHRARKRRPRRQIVDGCRLAGGIEDSDAFGFDGAGDRSGPAGRFRRRIRCGDRDDP